MNATKNLFTSIALVVALFCSLIVNAQNEVFSAQIWREVPGTGGTMENLTPVCTLTQQSQLWAIAYPPAGGAYYSDQNKTGTYPVSSVFLRP